MRHIHVHDRYAQTPPDSWIGRWWQSTRRLACGCCLTGIITALKPGAVRVQWSQCLHWPDSWEPTDRGTLAREWQAVRETTCDATRGGEAA